MSIGPVTYLEIEFQGKNFKGEIVPALKELVDKGMIRIMDLVIVLKDEDGLARPVELSDIPAEAAEAFEGLSADNLGLLTYDDIAFLAESLQNNSAAGILLFENLWTKRFVDAVANADGRWVAFEGIAPDVLNEALAAAD